MSFIWPVMLIALVLIPIAVVGYLAFQRSRAARGSALAASGLVTVGTSSATGKRRHVPFAIFLVGFGVLVFALARPEVALAIPKLSGTVVLVIDVSNSMAATDVQPTRLDAAKAAAKEFVNQQPPGVSIGVVAFGSGAQVVAATTEDREEVIKAIDRLKPGGATEISGGLLSALNTIVDDPIILTPEQLQSGDVSAVRIGYHPSAAIVLASDGEATGGTDPAVIADLAASAGIHVTTIGIGSQQGATIEVDGFQVATALDETQLKNIAKLTNGQYFRAADAASLTSVYDRLDMQFQATSETVEITGLLSAIALILFVVAAALSMIWLGRLV